MDDAFTAVGVVLILTAFFLLLPEKYDLAMKLKKWSDRDEETP